MNLINKKLLQQKYSNYEFPTGVKAAEIDSLIDKWQYALKERNLEKTKEKSIQGDFLAKFFSEILGYKNLTSIEKNEDIWTLIQHPNIENNSGEPDGSLGFFTKEGKDTRAVIELKDARTSLDKKQHREGNQTPIEQAYSYASKEDKCKWVIVSNFKEIRLYSKYRSPEYYEKFLISELDNEEEFKRFYFLLTKDNLIQKDGESIVEILTKETNQQEQDITKDFYSKYKEVRLVLLNHLIDFNPSVSKDILIEKTQKLLDRFIFTLFCEDTTELLPYEIVKKTYERALNSFAGSDERVWQEFKGLFQAIDKGNARVTPPINAYNGGLFKPDEILDNLVIMDGFWQHLMELANYDYQTELNVNILGHIFEQSISDLEEIKADYVKVYEDIKTEELQSEYVTKAVTIEKKGKRKKEGIFYTPEFITRYLVENTVGNYLDEYPDKLESIKILDPACGSGAFLNKAHTCLLQRHLDLYNELTSQYEENKTIGFLQEDLQVKKEFNLASTNKSVLLNNLFGVDLNQESVEITKLSLWLKTASKQEPLQNLDKNVKCGNSVIDDVNIAGKKAFNWKKEFEEITNNGGFDVIIGNPPYVRQENIPLIEKEWMKNNYTEVGETGADLYIYFFALAVRLLKDGGYLGFIAPNKWMERNYGEKLRKYLIQFEIVSIVNYGELKIFPDAATETAVIILRKIKSDKSIAYTAINDLLEAQNTQQYIFNSYAKNLLNDGIWRFVAPEIKEIISKLSVNSISLQEYTKGGVYYGIKTGLNEAFIIDKKIRDEIISNDPKSSEIVRPMLEGDDFGSWHLRKPNRYMIATGYDLDIKEKYKGVYDWLLQFESQLQKRQDKGKNWWNLRACDYYDELEKPKIVYYHTALRHSFYFDTDGYYISANCYFISNADRYIQAILNSRVFNFAKVYLFPAFGNGENGGRIRLDANKMYNYPIPTVNDKKKEEIEKAVKVLSEKSQIYFNEKNNTLLFLLQEYNFLLSRTNVKNFTDIGWNEFTELLSKQKIKLSLTQKEELNKWIKSKQSYLLKLQEEIYELDYQLNMSIYHLYNLTEEEIKLVERR